MSLDLISDISPEIWPSESLLHVDVTKLFILSPKFLVLCSPFTAHYMPCYCVYTPLWLWYWPWVHNVLQRIAWGKKILLHSKAVGRPGRRLSEQKPWRVQPRRRERELGATPSEIRLVRRSVESLKGWVAERVAEDTCEMWNCTRRSWGCGITWIARRRRWSRYRESPRRRNVRDAGCEDDGAGLPRRDLRAVAVPREFCVIKNRLRANLKLCRVIPQQINKTHDSWQWWMSNVCWG